MDIDQHQTNKGLEIGDRLLQISSDVNDDTLFIIFLMFIFISKIFMIYNLLHINMQLSIYKRHVQKAERLNYMLDIQNLQFERKFK